MSSYNQVPSDSNIRFSRAAFSEAEHSQMNAYPLHLTTFNAGQLIPIYCREVLPDQSFPDFEISDAIIRQSTLKTPTMGNMFVDFYAFFVPNRIVNQSWKTVEGENYNGSWTANHVSLAPLKSDSLGTTQIPVGSVADYYGFPTQLPVPNSVLSLCHDLKFRGYVMIWNEHFRDQNYQPPIPMSTLNVYQGFLDSGSVGLSGGSSGTTVSFAQASDGSFGAGAIKESLYGSGSQAPGNISIPPANASGRFRATSAPLKVNKIHDYFTSVLPSPQKSLSDVFTPVTGQIGSVNVVTGSTHSIGSLGATPLRWSVSGTGAVASTGSLCVTNSSGPGDTQVVTVADSAGQTVVPNNLVTESGAEVTGLGLSVNDLRMASALQQVYEVLALGGSRYRELVRSFFGIDVDDPFSDVPQLLGHFTRNLELFQTAQTSASEEGSTPQGNLAGFGYTATGGRLFSEHRFLEHGYLHVFAVVRHRNIYSSFLARDNFRLNMMDFYLPPLANISNQPVYIREINPFYSSPNDVFGYQEAWAEYRYEPDQVSGYMRPGISGSLSLWNYADDFDSTLGIANGDWLQSNSQSVLDRSLAVTSELAHQFKAQFGFSVDKVLPMPTFSTPGLDII